MFHEKLFSFKSILQVGVLISTRRKFKPSIFVVCRRSLYFFQFPLLNFFYSESLGDPLLLARHGVGRVLGHYYRWLYNAWQIGEDKRDSFNDTRALKTPILRHMI